MAEATKGEKPPARKGLERFTLDLHVHTPASYDWKGGDVSAPDVVANALSKSIDALAVTDHGTGAWVDQMKEAAANTALTIFPGVELNNLAGNDGIHLLVLFPLDTTSADIERFLAKVGAVKGVGERVSRGAATEGPIQVLNAVLDFDGIAVLAHCASSKGALGELRGQLRDEIVRHPAVLAAESTSADFHDEQKALKRKRIYDLLDGKDPGYGRELAVYQASDNPHPSGGGHALDGIGARVTHIYAQGPLTLESVRQAFVDRDARIDIPTETVAPPIERSAHVAGMAVTGGFLDGLDIELHNGLTTILGAKGSGKSLQIELLRFGLDQRSAHPEIRRDHDLKLKTKLGLHGRVKVRVRTVEGGVMEFEREFNPDAGDPFHGVSILPPEVIRAHFLSQGEVIRIAESEDEQIRFIDSFFDFATFQRRMASIRGELTQLDEDVAQQMKAWKERDGAKSKASQLEAQIDEIDKKLKNPVFAKQRLFEAKSQALGASREYLVQLGAAMDEAVRRLELVPVPPEPDPTVAEDPEVKRLRGLQQAARKAALTALSAAVDELATTRGSGTTEFDKWTKRAEEEANILSAEIRAQGGDLAVLNQQRARLARDLSDAKTKQAASQQIADLLAPTVQKRDELITALREAQTEYTQARQDRCQLFEAKSEGKIRASVAAGVKREEFRQRLLLLKKGSYLSDIDVGLIAAKVAPDTFVRSLLRFDLSRTEEDLDPIASDSGLPRDRIVALAEFMFDADNAPGYEALLRLQYSTPPADKPLIEFRREDGSYSPLDELSTGQKCTSLLIMILCEGDLPIVIDQPEDSLDIRSIWEDMCLRLRRSKRSRQFIFTTHNSSLAVASDSDMFVVLQADASHGEVFLDGAIDTQDVRDEVIKLLEGGERTYFLKQRKYNIADPYQRRAAPN
jgi:PHP family Zn ribbon phosphoesterase